MEETPKKGMSKGCIVGLVIAGVVVVAVILVGWWIYANKDEVFKQSVILVVNSVKTQLNDNPVEGVDVATFTAVADGFIQRIESEETLDSDKLQNLGLAVQAVAGNMENPDAASVELLQKALIGYYPELGELVPDEVEVLEEEAVDTPAKE